MKAPPRGRRREVAPRGGPGFEVGFCWVSPTLHLVSLIHRLSQAGFAE